MIDDDASIEMVRSCYKKAQLSQRWLRDAPYIWVPWRFLRLSDYAYGYFSKLFDALLFWSTLWTCIENLKCVAFAVPEITAIGVFGWGLWTLS